MEEPEHSPEYFLSIFGQFVNQFALTENILFLFLTQLLGISRDEGAAILSGSKVAACCSSIRRLYEARNRELPTEIEDCLSQLMVINSLRNDILHNGTTLQGLVSTHVKAMPAKTATFTITSGSLRAATTDLFKISTVLTLFAGPVDWTQEEAVPYRDAIKKPWQYKQLSQVNNHQRFLAKKIKHLRPPKSSPLKPE